MTLFMVLLFCRKRWMCGWWMVWWGRWC